ncbi:hypothetical protein [Peristeroidobacter soli]|uniref:hypothetical protein n=1 Tax=Peristeroidobacter soli TaxID=2497877 RepID=UPI00101D41F7|nr:hypothetical protein [Peristeroidobacter soli]
MARFSYDDIVKIKVDAKTATKRHDRAWVVGIMEDRRRFPLNQFPTGIVYSIEFEDGTALDVHENDLEPAGDA